MIPQEIIRRKRDGHPLPATEIEAFIAGLVDGRVTEGQAAAFAMAIFFRGMDRNECVALTRAMTESGARMEWDLPGPALDKHSTGGIGDSVSLLLAPLIAACGGYVPMISGRGLGHTGGTLDKLDSIPGYISTPDRALFRHVVRDVGCAIIGQTSDLAPADRILYGIRDVTATVESIPLITASILSKKIAAGLDGGQEGLEEFLDVLWMALIGVEGDQDVVFGREEVDGFCEHDGTEGHVFHGSAGGKLTTAGGDLDDAVGLRLGEGFQSAIDRGEGGDVDGGVGVSAFLGGINHGTILGGGGDGHFVGL